MMAFSPVGEKGFYFGPCFPGGGRWPLSGAIIWSPRWGYEQTQKLGKQKVEINKAEVRGQ